MPRMKGKREVTKFENVDIFEVFVSKFVEMELSPFQNNVMMEIISMEMDARIVQLIQDGIVLVNLQNVGIVQMVMLNLPWVRIQSTM